jgi:O-antigen/teichoic acid export membrane protein
MDLKLIAKNSILLYVRMLIALCVGFFTTRIVLQALGETDYGIFNVVSGTVALIGFINTILITSTYRFISYEMGKGNFTKISHVFSTSLFIHICLSVIVFILGESIGVYYINNILNVPFERLSVAMIVFQVSLITACVNIISIPFQGLLTAYENFSYIALLKILTSILNLFVALSLSLFSNVLIYYAILMCVSRIIISILYVVYCLLKYKQVKIKFRSDRELFKEIFSFSGWIAIGAAAFVGKVQGTNLVINYYFGPVFNASFGIAKQVNGHINNFAGNIGRAFVPQITKSYASGKKKEALSLVTKSSRFSFFLIYIISLPVLMEIDFLLKIWLNEYPLFTPIFCRLMIYDLVINACNSGIPAIINATGKVKYFNISLSVITLLTLPLAIVAFEQGHPPYAISLIYIIATIVATIVRQILLQRIINFDVKTFIRKTYLKAFYVVLLTFFPILFLRSFFDNTALRFFIVGFVSIILTALIIYFIGMERTERIFIRKMVGKKIFGVKKYL